MYRIQQTIRYKNGAVLRSAPTAIFEADGVTLSDLFDIHGQQIANPTTTDPAGVLTFYVFTQGARYYQATNGVIVTEKTPLDLGHTVAVIDRSQVSIDRPAGGSVISGYVVVANSVGAAVHGSNRDMASADAILGVANNSALMGTMIKVIQEGELVNQNWAWIPGQPVFLGWNGGLTQDPNQPGALFQQQVGVAMEPTKIKVDISPPIIFNAPR